MSAIKLTKREKSWIVYDVGNSAFVLLASTLIPIYFSAIADPGSSVVVAWGYATTVASLLLALLMPFLGSIADLKGNKKRLLVGSIGTGAVLLACMGIPGNAMVFLVMYVVRPSCLTRRSCSTMHSLSTRPIPKTATTRCLRKAMHGATLVRARPSSFASCSCYSARTSASASSTPFAFPL